MTEISSPITIKFEEGTTPERMADFIGFLSGILGEDLFVEQVVDPTPDSEEIRKAG